MPFPEDLDDSFHQGLLSSERGLENTPLYPPNMCKQKGSWKFIENTSNAHPCSKLLPWPNPPILQIVMPLLFTSTPSYSPSFLSSQLCIEKQRSAITYQHLLHVCDIRHNRTLLGDKWSEFHIPTSF